VGEAEFEVYSLPISSSLWLECLSRGGGQDLRPVTDTFRWWERVGEEVDLISAVFTGLSSEKVLVFLVGGVEGTHEVVPAVSVQ
jgi:hypothetical protein